MAVVNVALVGFMGAGKTSVGRKLAERLGLAFVDSDLVIAARAGKSVAEIFAHEGEAHFRTLERETLELLAHERGLVIATGGGAFVDDRTRRLLLDTAFVVYLEAPFETIWARVGGSEERPLIRAGKERVRELYLKRVPFYRQAHVTVDSGRPVDEVVKAVEEAYHARARPD